MENLVPDVAVDAVSESGCKLVKYLPKLVTPVAFFGGAILLYTFYKRKKVGDRDRVPCFTEKRM